MDWEKKINEIFDNAYSEDLPLSPKHTIFRRGKAFNEILSLIRQHLRIKLPENPYLFYEFEQSIRDIETGIKHYAFNKALQQVKETLEKIGFEVEDG